MTTNQLSKKKAAEVLKKYSVNEDNNSHTENYILLAATFEDKEARFIANANFQFKAQFGHANTALNMAAHEACNDYYYKLQEIAKS